jgi:FkbM family methyltransferase
MARIDFRKALRGELDRAHLAPREETRARPAPHGRPFWLRLLRAPLTMPRRFLVGALHLKLDGIISQQHVLLTSLSTLQQTADVNLAAIASTTAAIAERVERLEGIIGDRLHEIDIKSRGPHDYDDNAVAVRLNDGYVLVPKSAIKLRILLADAPADGLEPGTTRIIRRLLRPGMTAVDVGANVGALTLTCARAVGPTGTVYSFEPEPAFADLLAKAFDLNGVPWVELRRSAASSSNGKASFHVSPIGGHSSLYPLSTDEQRSETLIEVETCTLDDALGAHRKVDLIKMDVEGAELDVLAGMQQLVSSNPDLVIVAEFGRSHLKNQGLSADGWLDRFRSSGFAIYAIDELTSQCRPAIAEQLLQVESINLVMAKLGSRAYKILARYP